MLLKTLNASARNRTRCPSQDSGNVFPTDMSVRNIPGSRRAHFTHRGSEVFSSLRLTCDANTRQVVSSIRLQGFSERRSLTRCREIVNHSCQRVKVIVWI